MEYLQRLALVRQYAEHAPEHRDTERPHIARARLQSKPLSEGAVNGALWHTGLSWMDGWCAIYRSVTATINAAVGHEQVTAADAGEGCCRTSNGLRCSISGAKNGIVPAPASRLHGSMHARRATVDGYRQ
jgi:hypothetical protein